MAVSDWELWAAAQQVMKQHGARVGDHVAGRITALALAGDMEGVATWKRIADRIDQLGEYDGARPNSRH